MKKSLVGCLMMFAVSGCGEGVMAPEGTAEETSRGHDALVTDIQSIRGDTVCPANEYLMPIAEARAHQELLCQQLGTWDIQRLSGRGTMKGPGAGCVSKDWEPALIGATLCKTR